MSRGKLITVRLSSTEHQRLIKLAAREGIALAFYIRRAALAYNPGKPTPSIDPETLALAYANKQQLQSGQPFTYYAQATGAFPIIGAICPTCEAPRSFELVARELGNNLYRCMKCQETIRPPQAEVTSTAVLDPRPPLAALEPQPITTPAARPNRGRPALDLEPIIDPEPCPYCDSTRNTFSRRDHNGIIWQRCNDCGREFDLEPE